MHHPEETKQRILKAVRALWEEGGFPAITTRAVAATAKVNEVTLFRHFGSKEGLIRAMIDDVIGRLDSRNLVAADEAPTLAADLEHWARTYVEQTLPIADVMLLNLVEATRDPESSPWPQEFATRLPQALARHLESLQARGRISAVPCEEVARYFYAALFAHVVSARARPNFDADALSTNIAGTFAALLAPPAPVGGDGRSPS